MSVSQLICSAITAALAVSMAGAEVPGEKPASAPPKPVFAQVSDVQGLLAAVAKLGDQGGTIVLEPGTYVINEPIVINGKSNVSLTGSGWNTIIERHGEGDAIVFTGSCWQCSVRNLTVKGDLKAKTGSGIVFKEGGWSGITMIDYCLARDFAESGIRFDGDPKKPFSSNTVSNCWLVGNLGDQLLSRNNNDFYICGNQFGAQPDRFAKTGCRLEHSSAGTYTKNYHWGNVVGLVVTGSNFNRIENNRIEESRESGILLGGRDVADWCGFTIITGNTIHTNSENNKGLYSAVVAYNAPETTFCTNQIFSWDSNSQKMKSGLVIGEGCKNWIVKDNNIRHVVEKAIVYDKKSGHIVKDNLVDEPAKSK